MIYSNGTFQNTSDHKIYCQYWLPQGRIKAVLIVVHGIAEHSGRYMNVVNYLIESGYAVCGYDHPGHGKSDGRRGFISSFKEFTETLAEFVLIVEKRYPGKKRFLLGHSMGGLISTVFLMDHQELFTAAILSGPAVKIPKSVSPVTILAGKMLSVLIPKAGLTGLDSSGICSDPDVVQDYDTDPLVYHGKTSARLAAEMLKAIDCVRLNAAKISLPVLIMHGGSDEVVNPDASDYLHEKISSTDKKKGHI